MLIAVSGLLELCGLLGGCSFAVPEFVIDDAVPEPAIAFPLLDTRFAIPERFRSLQGAGFTLVDTIAFDASGFDDVTEVGLVANIRNELERGAVMQVYFLDAEDKAIGTLFDGGIRLPAASAAAPPDAGKAPGTTRVDVKLSAARVALLPDVARLRILLSVAAGQSGTPIPTNAGIALQIGLSIR